MVAMALQDAAFDGVNSVEGTPIEASVDDWLARGCNQLEPKFPAAMEKFYIGDTAGERIRTRKTTALIGIITGILLTPALWVLVPGQHWLVLWDWCCVGLPVGGLSYVAYAFPMRFAWQEVQSTACCIVVALSYSIVMTAGGEHMLTAYFGGFLLLIMLNVIAAGSRFRLAVIQGFATVAIFACSLFAVAGLEPAMILSLSALMATCTFFAVYGAWRVETEARRSYALVLRGKIDQQTLYRRNSELDEIALRDALTGVANRRAYEAWKVSTWSAAEQTSAQIGMVIADIDNFKLYNDALGHAGGDECIRVVARCMQEQLRGTTDMLARIGGEEFAVLLPGASLEQASKVAERVRSAIEALRVPQAAGAMHGYLTISCGVASMVACQDRTPEDLFSCADEALYVAKREGRNRVCSIERNRLGFASTKTVVLPVT